MPSATSGSVQTVGEVLPRALSDVKENSDKDCADLDQFPEGGTAGWCAVLGG